MNPNLIKNYISEYKREFNRINQEERYKWKAIKHFQDHFNLEAADLAANIESSMDEAKNLLSSGKYWPKRMLRKNLELAPEKYYLYRLFHFKDSVSPADLKIISGDLSSIWLMPVSYQVNFNSKISLKK